MRQDELNEAAGLARQALDGLLGTLAGPSGAPGARLRYLCGALRANAPVEIASGAFWADMTACFEQARNAGATYTAMDQVRALAEAFAPSFAAGIAVQN